MDPNKQPMADLLDVRFNRVEKALETLIKSISTYNPSPSIANDLVSADSSLNEGLTYLHTHQTNHQRLVALRDLSSTLDTTIKDTLLLLTTTRSEILSTPGTKLSDASSTHPVSYSELLSYARRISKTTLPHTYREPAPSTAEETPKEGGLETNGNTPVNGLESNGTAVILDADKAFTSSPNALQDGGAHGTALPPQFKLATTLPDNVFTPWPHDMLLRRGALATIQLLREKGEEIEGYDFDGEKGREEEERRKRVEVEEAEAEERERERERARRSSMHVAGSGSGSGGGGGGGGQKKKQFELETFDSDDDEEDE